MGGDLWPKAALTVHPFAQPDRLRDEELAELEDEFRKLTCESTDSSEAIQVDSASSKSPVPSLAEEKSLPAACHTFLFHGQPVGEVHQPKRGSVTGRLVWAEAWLGPGIRRQMRKGVGSREPVLTHLSSLSPQ